ncbi:MAG TPA: hypothetical protein VML94_01155 [Thermoplasmata archaeon]|nr:hypothetical protein [Thermoplasmata archaeon]
MLSFSDQRGFSSEDERFARCLFCGKDLVVLPNDRRAGSCFDCLTLSVPVARPCPGCGAMIPGEERAGGCSACGWYPLRD